MAAIGILRCKCELEIRSMGRLHGVNMGEGWVRITTHPECPVHALCQGYTKARRAQTERGRYLYCPVHRTKDCG